MKTDFKKYRLPVLAAILGSAAGVLRAALLLLGTDEKGLLIPGHPLDILVWVITAAAILGVAALVRKLDGSQQYDHNFAPSGAACLGCFALAAAIAVTTLTGLGGFAKLDRIRDICGLLAIPAALWAGICRRKGTRPFFLFHAAVCLYLTLYAVSRYQSWSSLPQLQDYVFSVLASCLLPLFGYYQTAFDVDMGNRRMQLGTGLLAAFFCITALAGATDPVLYLGGAIWTLTNLCSLNPRDDDHAAA